MADLIHTKVTSAAAQQATKATVFTGPGKLLGISIENPASNAITYVQLFDALAADVTVGSTTPKYAFAVDAAAASHVTVRDIKPSNVVLMEFNKGLVVAATTTATGNTDPSAGVLITFWTQ